MLLPEVNIRAGQEAPFSYGESVGPEAGGGSPRSRRRRDCLWTVDAGGEERVGVDAWSLSYARVGTAGRVVRRERCRGSDVERGRTAAHRRVAGSLLTLVVAT